MCERSKRIEVIKKLIVETNDEVRREELTTHLREIEQESCQCSHKHCEDKCCSDE